jgi:uncharacterized protein (TIGR03067 family)
MTRALAGAVLALVAVGVAGADNPKDKDEGKAAPIKGLEGTWVYVSYTLEGRPREEPVHSGRKFVFTGEKFTVGVSDKDSLKGTYATNLTKVPAEIDLDYEHTRPTARGIFKLDGDTLTLCLAYPGVDRPTKFESNPGSIVYLIVMKRLKP